MLNRELVEQQGSGINYTPGQTGAVAICYILVSSKALQISFICVVGHFLK